MADPTPLPGKPVDQPSPLDGLSRQELKTAALSFLGKAQDSHQAARRWESRALRAEAELAALRATQGLT